MTPTTDLAFDLGPAWALLPWVAAAASLFLWVRRKAGPAQARAGHWSLRLLRGTALVGLVAVAANPVRVSVTPGTVHRPEIHVLLDASQSMRLGTPQSRWGEATAIVREALERQNGHTDVRV